MTAMRWALGVCIALLVLLGSCFLSERARSAELRRAYTNSLALDRAQAKTADSAAKAQLALDSAAIARATHGVAGAFEQSRRTGNALPGKLPTIPAGKVLLDSAEVANLRTSLTTFAQNLAVHLATDSAVLDSVTRLVRTLHDALDHARAEADSARAQRDRVTDQLAGAVGHLQGGHSWKVDALGAALFFIGGRLSKQL